jgi:hypothetical protein
MQNPNKPLKKSKTQKISEAAHADENTLLVHINKLRV